jgi:Icc-related predicted phosphoesterase
LIRVAATGDLHVGVDSAGRLRPLLADLARHADLFLLAGDLTQRGRPEEAKVLAAELDGLGVPTVAVLGNHDHHAEDQDAVAKVLGEAGISVLEGTGLVVAVGDRRVGVAGTKGFGGGFAGASASEFGEPEMKAFVRHTRRLAGRLERALAALRADRRIALLHYAPVEDTLAGEPRELYPFLGSYLLAEAVDRSGADLVLHGHAHRGSPSGVTPGGVPVRNVAMPVIGCAYQVFHFDPDGHSA